MLEILRSYLYNFIQLCIKLYESQIPCYGYLFVSTTIIMFLLEIKNTYKLKKLERKIMILTNKIEG